MGAREEVLAPIIETLRSSYGAAKAELESAEHHRDQAIATYEEAQRRFAVLRAEWKRLCDAVGIPLDHVVEAADATPAEAVLLELSSDSRRESSDTRSRIDPLALTPRHLQSEIQLPCRRFTQRWWAGQALYKLGGEAPLHVIAEEMRSLGYDHDSKPHSPRQLEASLSALPDQVNWIKRVSGRRGHLELVRHSSSSIASSGARAIPA
jgi:hypothetical protein